jgi:hypothetical protein
LLASVFPTTSNAFEFRNETGSVTGSFDTTISLGAAWRAEDRDPKLIGITNGGTARDVNSDDGNLNFDKHDPISSIIKVTHEFDLVYQNYGFFARGFYFYDHVGSEKDELGRKAKDLTGSEVELRDTYLRASYNPGGRALNLRLGSQVVSWGESTFIPNGINIINPIDLNQFRTPGSELRDALIAMPMLWGAQEISTNVTVEALILADHDKVRLDPRGTFFSTTDALSDDGDKIFIGSGRRVDQHKPQVAFGVIPAGPAVSDASAPVWAPRSPDRNPKDSGEFGVAFRLFSPELNNTEFGVFAVHYHSRTPILSATRGAATVAGLDAATVGFLNSTFGDSCTTTSTLINFNALVGDPAGQRPCTATTIPLVQANYFAEYPEDIRLYGLSFNTQGPAGIAIQGEWSYRPNQPIQLATTELILAAGGLANNVTGNATQAATVFPGTEIRGFRRIEMHQVQTTLTKAFGPSLGSDQLIAIGEIGYTHLDLPDDLLFAGPGVFLPAQGSNVQTTAGSNQPGNEGYATRNSWGYRLLARMEFNNAIGAATLSPRIAFSHDVEGVSPTFNEDTKAITVGLGYNLRQVWQADLAYTSFYGGRTYSGTDPAMTGTQPRTFATSANPLKDRDFLAVSLSYAF